MLQGVGLDSLPPREDDEYLNLCYNVEAAKLAYQEDPVLPSVGEHLWI